ncbi:sugar ABC transporter substrate-binding protein [Agromyces sp. ZXT2-6]|uniref:sugar ABC transporter substrate-binding protein n=1 Tax=Agromyces sp. ZXT2-6 TaxID=3461153 RepID=UPI004054FE0B
MVARRNLAVAAAGAVALMGLAGCSGASGGGGGGDGDEEARVLGVVQFSASDVFSNAALEGGAEYARQQGWEVQTVDAKGSVDEMNAAMTNLVTTGADALLVSVFPTEALAAGVASAIEAGVPVANWGGGTGDGVQFAGDVWLDESSAKMVEDMGGEGEVLTLGYRPGLPCQGREAGLDELLEGTDITQTKQQITIPGQVESAQAATAAWAAAHPAGGDTPLAVWSCFDDPATGAVAALRDLGRTDVLTYGINGTEAAVRLVEGGELTATTWYNSPQQGEGLAELLIEYLDDPDSVEVPQTIGTEVVLVTSETVEEFLAGDPTLY